MMNGAPPLVGHEWAVDLIQHGLTTNHMAQSYLLVGPPRIGKTSLALYMARALNCLGDRQHPCESCSACQKTAHGRHPDVRVIDDPDSSIKVDLIRELQQEMALLPYEGRRRVYVLCNFQQATAQAANCLLKTLEEPLPHVTLILTAMQTDMLLPTIVSRCQVLSLRALPADQVQQALETYWQVQPERASLLARLSGGRIGWAIEATTNEALLRNRDKYLIALEQALRQDRTERMGLAQQLCQNPQVVPDVLELWQGWWRDLLLAKSGNTRALINVDRESTIAHEAQRFTWNEMLTCLNAVQRAAQQVEQNVSPCLALEVLLLRMPRLSLEADPTVG